MIRNKYLIAGCLALAVTAYSCGKDFLEKKPYGSLDEGTLANQQGVEALLVGAYSMLDGVARNPTLGGWESTTTNWVYGGIAGGEAHKGSDAGDQPAINPIERHEHNATNPYFEIKWNAMYEGITRANSTIKVMANAADISEADKTRIAAEARALRAFYYLELKRMFNNIPWIDETTTDFKQPNTTDTWPNIEADIKFAYDNLPEAMSQKGRWNKWSAGALYGKILMYQGAARYAEAKTVLENVYNNGKTPDGIDYALNEKYQDNFNAETKNSSESVFAAQYSVNDGASDAANGGWGEVLNFPYNGGPGGCCGFYQPSQDLVNSYKTNADGLPDPDNYNTSPVKDDEGVEADDPFTPYAGNLDPRLDWTVGRRGIPYLDWGNHPGVSWIRLQPYGGPYSPKKNTYYKSQQGSLTDKSFWTSGVTANNYTIIRFADVILWLAELEAEIGSPEKAKDYVNMIRNRAANPVSWVYKYKNDDPAQGASATPAANYVIKPYPASPAWDKATALKAIRFERKLELGMEGHRFFDLVRWGIAAETLNKYFTYESTKRQYLQGAKFTAGKNEYFPIPQNQIDLSANGAEKTLQQNPNY